MNSIKERNDEYGSSLGQIDGNFTELEEVIAAIEKYENIIKTQNKKIISFVAKQGQIFKKFKDSKQLFDLGQWV